MRRSLRRAGLPAFPPWVGSYHLRRFEPRKRLALLLALARREHERNGLRLVIMDGLVDFLRDFNDVGESTDLINKLMELIDETGCCVLPTLHVNPGQKRGESSDKGRGHLGTIFEQKAETILLLKKKQADNKEVISLSTKDARHGLGAGIQFAWDEDTKMHLRIRENLTPMDGLDDGMTVLARDAFDGWAGGAMPYTMLVERIEKSSGCSRRTAVRRLNDILAEGLVEKTDGGLYLQTL